MIHWVDIFIVGFLASFAFWSYLRGFTREVFSLASLVAGYLCASSLYLSVAPHLGVILDEKDLRAPLAFVLIFIAVTIIVKIVGIYARRLLRLSETLGMADKMAGGGVGLVKGGLLLIFMIYVLTVIPGMKTGFIRHSMLGPRIAGVGYSLMKKMAPGLADTMKKAGARGKHLHDNAKTVERYRRKLENLKSGIAKEARSIKSIMGKSDTKDKTPDDKITRSDREALDKLIKKLD